MSPRYQDAPMCFQNVERAVTDGGIEIRADTGFDDQTVTRRPKGREDILHDVLGTRRVANESKGKCAEWRIVCAKYPLECVVIALL